MNTNNMSIFKKKKICVTHNGAFHTDDLFATATLSILNNRNIKIIRTRDPKVIATGDYVYDVSGDYNPEKNIFDHHQKGGAGNRDNGIPYSSFGLIWKTYGEKICGSKEVADRIDIKIVQPIDAKDNGFDILTPKIEGVTPYSAQEIFMAFYPTWKEDNSDIDNIFKNEVKRITLLLLREIEVSRADVEGEEIIVDSYNRAPDKKIVIIERSLPRYLIQNTLPKFPEPIYFIYPSGHDDSWKVEAVREDLSTMKSRKFFPEAWRGLMNSDAELRRLTEVNDALFCHQSGFFAHVKSKEGAIKLAEKALIS